MGVLKSIQIRQNILFQTLDMTEELKQYLESEGYVSIREIPGRGVCALYSFMFTIGLVYGIDLTGYKGRWCYDSVIGAVNAISNWDGIGDPPGAWIKYKGEGGERSNAN